MKVEITKFTDISLVVRGNKNGTDRWASFNNLHEARIYADWLENQGYEIKVILEVKS
jgi:hypothetical protein